MNQAIAANPPSGKFFPLILAGLAALALVGAYWVTADISPLRPDTASYLYFDPSRPIGYPAFLWVAGLFGEPQLAVRIQMAALAGSLFLLGWSFYRWSGSWVLSALFQLTLAASPEMWKFSAALITEALATAGVALWCGQLLLTMRRPSLSGLGILTVISAGSALVKPSLVVMFVATGIATLLLKGSKQRYKALSITAVGLIAAIGANPAANYLLHGSAETGSPVARGILQHTLFCPMPVPPADPDAQFVEEQAKPVRDYIASAPQDSQEQLRRIYTGKLRFGSIIPTLGQRHGLGASWQTDDLVSKIAKQRIGVSPDCYLRSVVRTYFALSTYKSYSRADAKQLSNWLAVRPPPDVALARPLPRDEELAVRAARDIGASDPRFAGRQDFEPPSGRPLPLIWIARILYGASALIGLIGIMSLFVVRRVEDHLARLIVGTAALGILFHGVFGLTAMIEIHLTRYTVPLWPVVCTSLGIVGFHIVERIPVRLVRHRKK